MMRTARIEAHYYKDDGNGKWKIKQIKTKNNEAMRKYDLVGVDGNAFAVMGYTKKAMKQEGCSKEDIEAYEKDAISGDYNHLLCASMEVIDKLNENAQVA